MKILFQTRNTFWSSEPWLAPAFFDDSNFSLKVEFEQNPWFAIQIVQELRFEAFALELWATI
ncbi:MAG: hypothetical protein ACJ746_22635 [Bryobacteraceae bacterium]